MAHEEEYKNETEIVSLNKLNTLEPPAEADNCLKSTFKKTQRSWVDPWEPAVQDTFYHKQLDTLRPTFDIVRNAIIGGTSETLEHLFDEENRLNYNAIKNNLDQLDEEKDIELEEEEKAMQDEKKDSRQFGMWDGVIARNLLNIFGVIMFLRVGFVVGQAGIIEALIIMAISSLVVLLTALSMSAICTNGTILSGGAYYMISRALGPSIGGAIGILFSLGNMAACSLYLIGFAETLVVNLSDLAGFEIIDGGIWDVRIWSNIVLCIVLIISIVGLNCVVKTQLGLLGFIICAILLFFIGSFYKQEYDHDFPNPNYPCPDCDESIKYLVITPAGWINGNFLENLNSGYEGYNFWSVFAIFFPAVTGIMAGANISGEIKNPAVDIPNGTLLSILVSSIIYMVMAVFVGAVTVRYELLNNELVMASICVWEYIILIGIYAATLSSAIASLVGAPRILQAVADDNLFPFRMVSYFAVMNKNGEPLRGYFLSFLVAFACNLIGELNAIAPLISQFFMLTYLLINFACFALALSKSPGWRPSFKYFNKYTAGIGAGLCLIIMFLLNWVHALIACLIAAILYSYVAYREHSDLLDINWGNAQNARKFYNVYRGMMSLRKTKRHIKNWRPGFLVLVRDPIKRAQMMLFAQTLSKSHSPIFYASVHTGDYRTNIRKFHEAHSQGFLPEKCAKNSKGFYESLLAESFRSGVQCLIQSVGMGSLRPNTLIIGYKSKWNRDVDDIVTEYVQILRDALLMGMGLMIPNGFKRINWILDEYAPPAIQHDTCVDEEHEHEHEHGHEHEHDKIENINGGYCNGGYTAWEVGQSKETVIDVWWMIDDGGLCMLIPFLMQKHRFWQKCTLRMLMVSDEDSVSTNIATMKSLIEKFRLPYIGPLFVPAKKQPNMKTIETYEALAKCKISQMQRPDVVKKWLILSELLFQYSRYSGLNVVTLPIPTKLIKPREYMALLHMLSDQQKLPPTIIMRGNGESTLTFYSE